ncbi:MAG TPA: insulinase family protein, partial [Candidatus Paceibacterota bacterium]
MKDLAKQSSPVDGVDLVVLPTGVRGVVALRISLLAGSRFASNRQIPELVAASLELGAEGMSKNQIARNLESNAIIWNISCGITWVDISVAMPRSKIDEFGELLSGMLSRPTFPEEELLLLKERSIAMVLASKQETGQQAWKALSRNLFNPEHPLYEESEEEEIDKIKAVTQKDLVDFHSAFYGTGRVKFVVTGDANASVWSNLVKLVFSPMKKKIATVTRSSSLVGVPVPLNYLTLPDKSSVDVFLALPLALDINSREYFALKLGLHILGGDFVSRLMQEVREKRGLTYGTNASLVGLNDGDTGLFFVWGTFAPGLLAKGTVIVRDVLKAWVKRGISKGELLRTKEAIPGNYLVSLSNSGGVAGAIMN